MSSGMGGYWQMVRLPHAGAVSEQDARLMSSLSVLRNVENVLLSEAAADG